MIARVTQYMVGYVQRTIRRFIIRAAVSAVAVSGVVGYRFFSGDTSFSIPLTRTALTAKATRPRAARPVARVAPARATPTMTVQLAGEPAAVAPTVTAPTAAAPTVAAPPQIGIPDINGPKRAAQRAADATNANISEQTGQALPNRGGAAPAVVGPRSGPGSVPAVPPPAGSRSAALPTVTREVFTYEAQGRRDPFYSLILTEDLRPLLSDLRLVGVLYEASGRRSVAIMRDLGTNAQYRVAQGQTLGRMRVAAIRPKGVIFTIDEFGLSRQDSLMLSDTLKVRIR